MPGPDLWTRRRALGLLAAAGLAPRLARASEEQPADLAGWGGDPGSFTLSNATLLLHDGSVLPGAGLRVEDGLVVELGTGVRGGEDLGGAWLCPGMVDAGTHLGLVEIGLEGETHDDSEPAAVSPDARVWDAYNPLSDLLPVTRAYGVTHSVVTPGWGRLVSGQAAVFRHVGRTVDEALVQAPVGLCVGLGRATGGEGGPKSRMGVAMQLRAILSVVEPPEEEPEEPPRKRRKAREEDPGEDEKKPPADRVWEQLRARKLKVLFKAERADDLLTAVRLAEELELDAVIVGGAEAWVVVDELARSGVPLLLGPVTVQPSSFEHLHARYDNAARLHAAGVRFALRTASSHNSRLLPVEAGLAVAHGLPHAAAMHAVTAAAGEILGVPGLGRLEVGLPATLVQVAGDPLQPRYPVQRVWIDGRPTSMQHRQQRLYEAFKVLR